MSEKVTESQCEDAESAKQSIDDLIDKICTLVGQTDAVIGVCTSDKRDAFIRQHISEAINEWIYDGQLADINETINNYDDGYREEVGFQWRTSRL